MSRLIDADALQERLDKRRTYEIMGGRNKAYGKGVRDAMKDLEDEPTVDAIPVEWLREKMKWADDEGDIDSVDLFSWILQAWQKEQEAQDG